MERPIDEGRPKKRGFLSRLTEDYHEPVVVMDAQDWYAEHETPSEGEITAFVLPERPKDETKKIGGQAVHAGLWDPGH